MPDYSKSVIYKIYDNTNGDTYYGSTCNELRFRIKQHKHDAYSTSAKRLQCHTTSKSIILNDDYTYSVVEEFPCENRHQLLTRERWYIENNQCVNKNIPSRTRGESDAEYYKTNKEVVLQRKSVYYQKNREEKLNKAAERRAMKQDEINKKQMEVHHANKDAINEKRRANRYVCECGMTINKEYTSRHIKTARHIKLISCPPCLPCPPSPQSEPVSSV